MRQLTAFVNKEFLEQLRTGRLMVLGLLSCLFGIMNPAIAKLTPWLLEMMSEQLAESGMVIAETRVDALTSWTQFFKNIPMLLIVFLLMFSGILTAECQSGTLVHMLTKGLDRWKAIAAKLAVMALLWTLGYLLTFGITYGYNAYFWDNHVVQNLLPAVFGYYLAGLWLITAILPASAAAKSPSAVTLFVGAVFVCSYLLGFVPALGNYVPTSLMNSNELLAGMAVGKQWLAAAGLTVFLMAAHVTAAVALFHRREL